MATKYSIRVKKDGRFYVGYSLGIPQARGQGNIKKEAIEDTKKAIKLCKGFLREEKIKYAKLVNV